VLLPLVRELGPLARWIAEGALMRLNAGARSFVRYRAELARPRACFDRELARGRSAAVRS